MMMAKRNLVAKVATGLLAAALSLSSFTVTEGVAEAQPAAQKKPEWMIKKEAQKAYKDGKTALGKGDYKGALEAFKKADELVPGAAPKYNVAICYDELGMIAEAIQAYKTFIGSDPGAKYKDRVIESGKRIAELEAKMLGTVTLQIAPAGVAGVTVTVDGKPAEGTELKLEPGEHTIEVSAEGHDPQTQKVTVEQGGAQELSITLTPTITTPMPDPLPADDDDATDEGGGDVNALQVAGFVTLGLTVVGGVLTAVFGVQALGKKSDFDATPTTELADDAESAAVLSDVFLGVTIAMGITSAVLLGLGFSGDSGEDTTASSTPKFLPYAGPQGGGGVVTWTF
jgi:hypothetical protein